jgi:hypothetical protein
MKPEDLKPEDLIKLGDQKSSHRSVTELHPWISTQVKMFQLNIM